MGKDAATLDGYRAEIDTVDDQIIALLKARAGLVRKVGALKGKEHPGAFHLRSGREASMLRRVYQAFVDEDFKPEAAAALWRIIIAASTAIESPLTVSAYAPRHDADMYWLAREYFGSFTPIMRQTTGRRVLSDVLDGKAQVGLLPFPGTEEAEPWWTALSATAREVRPMIFAHVPFVVDPASRRDDLRGLAMAKVTPEPTGNDHSLIVIEADEQVSAHRLKSLCDKRKIEANWLNVLAVRGSRRLHLVELAAFVEEGDAFCHDFLAELAQPNATIVVLGAYGSPITLPGVPRP